MVAHTGFLIFARRIEPSTDVRAAELLREQSVEQVVEKDEEQKEENSD
jgi:hypothetical protein